jgi:hypothetical protein
LPYLGVSDYIPFDKGIKSEYEPVYNALMEMVDEGKLTYNEDEGVWH